MAHSRRRLIGARVVSAVSAVGGRRCRPIACDGRCCRQLRAAKVVFGRSRVVPAAFEAPATELWPEAIGVAEREGGSARGCGAVRADIY